MNLSNHINHKVDLDRKDLNDRWQTNYQEVKGTQSPFNLIEIHRIMILIQNK
jgi:hypothetical protein